MQHAKNKITPVILAGGQGKRLWPLSRANHPKQFITLPGLKISTFEMTLTRVANRDLFNPPIIVCSQSHSNLVREILDRRDICDAKLILEPCARNTAPALCAALIAVQNNDPMLVLPADHVIEDLEAFSREIERAAREALNGAFICFGIEPDSARSVYGYVQKGTAMGDRVFEIKNFKEKPTLKIAKNFFQSGDYLWNSGIFIALPQTFQTLFEAYAPTILKHVQSSLNQEFQIDRETYSQLPNISIDYALCEKIEQAVVIHARFDWCDIGSFQSLFEKAYRGIIPAKRKVLA